MLDTSKTEGYFVSPDAVWVDTFKEQEKRKYHAGDFFSSGQRNTTLNESASQDASPLKNKEKRRYIVGQLFYNGWRDEALNEPALLDASTSNDSSIVNVELLVSDTFVTRKY